MSQTNQSRLDDLAALKDGWYDGQGKSISPDTINRVQLILKFLASHSIRSPYIYPTTDGGIQIEWSGEKWELEIEFLAARINAMAIYKSDHRLDFHTSLSGCMAYGELDAECIKAFVEKYTQ